MIALFYPLGSPLGYFLSLHFALTLFTTRRKISPEAYTHYVTYALWTPCFERGGRRLLENWDAPDFYVIVRRAINKIVAEK
ncbi:hypothetical protein DP113_25040 [Brasilonema octagenarum UFV-E1]|uniref:Uncharacterized protein n=2 Tax=Scytonemataceae TaxID=1182 RepID=A0ABX1M3E2_9CYAN|nr:hypothetical protein [Brasilonema octagenarum UFV-OR1]QDL17092.1 hypothetical protein DP113_25040 [Brasilonema octagenarum UFV-E1]